MRSTQSGRFGWCARRPLAGLLLVAAIGWPDSVPAAVAFDVKGVVLGSGMLDAFLVLKERYGERVDVDRGRLADTDTIDITASTEFCGAALRRRCERIIVSSVLPRYRQKVVRIELLQSFFSEPTELELVNILLAKYGQPTIDETRRRRRTSSRVLVWAADSETAAAAPRHAASTGPDHNPGGRFVAVYFDVAPDGRVRGLKLICEDSALLEHNRDIVRRRDERLLEARRRAELAF